MLANIQVRRMLVTAQLTAIADISCEPRPSLLALACLGDAAMSLSKMNHAMLSFALLGGMLVGGRSPARPPQPPSPTRSGDRKSA